MKVDTERSQEISAETGAVPSNKHNFSSFDPFGLKTAPNKRELKTLLECISEERPAIKEGLKI